MSTAISEPKYKSFMKPSKFWKSTSSVPQQTDLIDERAPITPSKSTGYLPTFKFKKPNLLEEPCLAEVYKLSTIDQTGLYMPPSPTLEGKRDHWIEVNEEDAIGFCLPSSACLTSHSNEKHAFYTPSSYVKSQPYILPIADLSDSSLSSVPSLEY